MIRPEHQNSHLTFAVMTPQTWDLTDQTWLEKNKYRGRLTPTGGFPGLSFVSQWKTKKKRRKQHGWNPGWQDGEGAVRRVHSESTQHPVVDASWSALCRWLLPDVCRRLPDGEAATQSGAVKHTFDHCEVRLNSKSKTHTHTKWTT